MDLVVDLVSAYQKVFCILTCGAANSETREFRLLHADRLFSLGRISAGLFLRAHRTGLFRLFFFLGWFGDSFSGNYEITFGFAASIIQVNYSALMAQWNRIVSNLTNHTLPQATLTYQMGVVVVVAALLCSLVSDEVVRSSV